MKLTKRIVSVFMVITLLITCFSGSAMVTEVNAVTLAQLQEKYPTGAYWNHYVNNIYEAGDMLMTNYDETFATSISWSPCASHSATSADYYVGKYDCNFFDGAIQCQGFARLLAAETYGSRINSWAQNYTLSVKPGDVIHYTGYDSDAQWGHWVFVTSVSGSIITVGECNYWPDNYGGCRISWGRTIDLNNVSSCYVYSAPYALGTTQEAPRMWCENLNKPVEIQEGSGFTFTGNICGNNGVKWYALIIYEYLPETDEWKDIQILDEAVWQVGAFYTYSMNTLAKSLHFSSLNPGSYALSVHAMDFDGTYYTVEDMRFSVKCKHNYYTVETSPTCTEAGYTRYTCAFCSDTYVGNEVPALGHDYKSVVTAPTTTSQGFTTHTCTKCSHSYVDSYVPPVADENAPKIVVSESRARAGETVVVEVSLENNPGINAFTLSFEYADCLTLDKVEVNSALGGSFAYSKKAVWGSSSDSTFNGKILTLTFTVAEDAEPCEAAVTVKYNAGDICNYEEEDINFAVVAGKINVVDYIAGDVNGDGNVNSKDLTRLMRHLSGDEVTVVEAALDVNGDGNVNTKDWTRLMKYLAGEEVEIH